MREETQNKASEKFLEDFEDTYEALKTMQNTKEGKEKTVSLEVLLEEYGL